MKPDDLKDAMEAADVCPFCRRFGQLSKQIEVMLGNGTTIFETSSADDLAHRMRAVLKAYDAIVGHWGDHAGIKLSQWPKADIRQAIDDAEAALGTGHISTDPGRSKPPSIN